MGQTAFWGFQGIGSIGAHPYFLLFYTEHEALYMEPRITLFIDT